MSNDRNNMPAPIALHDSDSKGYPNLVLMKLSAWHKAKGDFVAFKKNFLTFIFFYDTNLTII